MRRKLLILSKDQFGYHTDTRKYCENLYSEFDITYLSLDWKKPVLENDNINLIKVDLKKGYFYKFLFFLWTIILHLRHEKYDIIFSVYFRFCFILPLVFDKSKFILDVRTGNVEKSKIKRIISDIELKFNSNFYSNITVISEGLAHKLKINKYKILPLGADKFATEKRREDVFNLLYVGTFNNRRLEDTIVGYADFLKQNLDRNNTCYTIIGDGSIDEKKRIIDAINKHQLEDKVKLLGRIEHNRLGDFFKTHNIGISYIPITSYYEFQPPTKTYEYLMNGLICVATKTSANSKILNKDNGVLCIDNPKSFSAALNEINDKILDYNFNDIVESVTENSWENISHKILKPILLEVLDDD